MDIELKTDFFFVKSASTYQLFDPISSHPYHFIKEIPCSQSVRLHRICTDNEICHKRNNFGKGLMRKGYCQNMIVSK